MSTTANSALQIGSSAATSIATLIAAKAAAGAAAGAAAAGGSAAGAAAGSAWVPIIGPAIAGVTLALGLWLNRRGPKQKIASTNIVNELEPILAENVKAYQEGPRTKASQAAALKNFDDAWAWLTSAQACGSADLGNPGRACISDRQSGGKWDWFAYYRNPIAADAARDDSFIDLHEIAPGLFGADAPAAQSNAIVLAGALILAGVLL